MQVVALDGRTTDVDKGTDSENVSTCIGENETSCNGGIDKDEEVSSSIGNEGVIKETGELLAGSVIGSVKLNDAGLNGLS